MARPPARECLLARCWRSCRGRRTCSCCTATASRVAHTGHADFRARQAQSPPKHPRRPCDRKKSIPIENFNQKTFRYLWRFCSLLFRGFFVAFPWLFRGPLLSRKTVFGPFLWFFRGFFVAPVLGKFYAYSPWNSLLIQSRLEFFILDRSFNPGLKFSIPVFLFMGPSWCTEKGSIENFNPRSIARNSQSGRPRSNFFNPRALWDSAMQKIVQDVKPYFATAVVLLSIPFSCFFSLESQHF